MDTVTLNHSADFIDRVINNNASDMNVVLYPPGDYYKWVIPLVNADEEYSNFHGEVLIARNNSIYPATRVILGMAKPWQQRQCRCDNLVVSEVGTESCSLCHFDHKGYRHYGIMWTAPPYPDIVRFRIMYNSFDFQLIPYQGPGDVVLNEEINNSIVRVNWDGTPL